jgi:uncharacterized membrane protein
MRRMTTRLLILPLILLLSLFTIGNQVSAASGPQNIIMTNMHIHVELGSDCSSTILIEANVTNTGLSDLSSFDMRIDVRGLQVISASLNGSTTNTSVSSVDNYVILTILPSAPISSGLSMILNVNFTTQCLQDRIGVNSDGSMYISNLIYYIRPLNEIHNLTFSAALPPYAVLYMDSASPLFPSATSNYTDGQRSIYVWKTESLLRGQEIAYIIKYLMPVVLLDAVTPVTDNSLLIGIIAAVGAAGTVLILERIPSLVNKLRTKEVIVSGKISSQEQEILDLLVSRGGSCPQREIYENLDMSQAMASMMLTSLEERGLIKRLRSGRENIVHIMED